MSFSREILTIQAGNYANFIGAHWWNIQESSFCFDPNSSQPLDINHDILFREGLNYKGEVTYTPRLVLIDLKENFKSLRKECPLYRRPDEDSIPLWGGGVEVIKEPSAVKNPFFESEMDTDAPLTKTSNVNPKNRVVSKDDEEMQGAGDAAASEPAYDFNSPDTSWSTFLKTSLHPQSFCLLDDLSPEGVGPVETFSAGHEVFIKSGKDMIEESIRKIAEDCDYLQGFQLIYDAYDGFSSIADHTLLFLNDEYCRRPSLCFPTYLNAKPPPYKDSKDQMHRLYAICMSLNSMAGNCTMFSPLSLSDDVVKQCEPYKSFPFLDYDAKNLYQTSALLAAAIETLTSHYRLKSQKFNLHDVTSAMTMWSRKLVCSSICLPFSLPAEEFLNTLSQSDNPSHYLKSISPCYSPESERTLFQSAVLRGIPKSRFWKPSKSIEYNPPSPEEVFGEYLNKFSPSSATTATVFEENCSLSFPFPKIFKENAVALSDKLSFKEGAASIPVAASFSSSDSAAPFLDSIITEVNKNSFKDYVKNAESHYEKDEFNETIQNIMGLRDNYQDY